MKVAILALQGAFIEHKYVLDSLNVNSFEIRQLKDINTSFNGLIIPGGESTTIGKLLVDLNLFTPLKNIIQNGLPVFGTCAGAILLAKEVVNAADEATNTNENIEKRFNPFATMDIEIKRNAYGRQLGSFFTKGKFNDTIIPMSFIRAPIISKVSDDCNILSTVNSDITAVRQANQLATTFHPELKTSEVHKYFIEMVKAC